MQFDDYGVMAAGTQERRDFIRYIGCMVTLSFGKGLPKGSTIVPPPKSLASEPL